jgi:Helicase conserved C-terminal domain
MSATMAAAMYQSYFGVPSPPLKVGVKRYPIKEVYLENLGVNVKLPMRYERIIQDLAHDCNKLKGKLPPNPHYLERVLSLAAQLALSVCSSGSSVLIFVSGMSDILSLTESIEMMNPPGSRVSCFSIHSDLPIEEQLSVFRKLDKEEKRIIIATNAAESSVTLPEVDNVICLGLCKQIVYNEVSHRQMLSAAWISRANAMQRAGRTGRLRAGTVYRLYTQYVYEEHFEAFEAGEMVRIPLDTVILSLKDMLPDYRISEVLMECLEPPDVKTIERSFENLYRWHFISSPDEDSQITDIGSFSLALGVDIMLGCLVGLGIRMGVGAEVIQLAAVLTFPKPVWSIGSPLVHSALQLNDILVTTFHSRCHFDANMFSDPLATMNLLYKYSSRTGYSWDWYKSNGISMPRIKQLAKTYDSLLQRVSRFVHIPAERLQLDCSPQDMPYSKLTVLRVIMAWVFNDSIIECNTSKFTKNIVDDHIVYAIQKKSGPVNEKYLSQKLGTRNPFQVFDYTETECEGYFHTAEDRFQQQQQQEQQPPPQNRQPPSDVINSFQSYCFYHEYDVGWMMQDCFALFYIRDKGRLKESVVKRLKDSLFTVKLCRAEEKASKAKRGKDGRPCGLWQFHDVDETEAVQDASYVYICRSENCKTKDIESIHRDVANIVFTMGKNAISCAFTKYHKEKGMQYRIKARGREPDLSQQDLLDMFGTAEVSMKKKVEEFRCKKAIAFPLDCQEDKVSKALTGTWQTPIIKSIPEGARLLNVLTSSYKGPVLKLPPQDYDEKKHAECEDEDLVEVFFRQEETALRFRWSRLFSGGSVMVPNTSIPVTVLPAYVEDGIDSKLYCVCSNALELRSGGIRVENITLLPPGTLFFLLCQISFGLCRSSNKTELMNILKKSLRKNKQDSEQYIIANEEFWASKIQAAIDFDAAAADSGMGEQLQCDPNIVTQFFDVFDGTDKYKLEPWDTLHSNIFAYNNKVTLRIDIPPAIKQSYEPCSDTLDGLVTRAAEGNDTSAVVYSHKGTGQRSVNLEGVGIGNAYEMTQYEFGEVFDRCWCLPLSRYAAIERLTQTCSAPADALEVSLSAEAYRASQIMLRLFHSPMNIDGETVLSVTNQATWSLYSVMCGNGKPWYYAEFDQGIMSFSVTSARGPCPECAGGCLAMYAARAHVRHRYSSGKSQDQNVFVFPYD